MMEIIKEEIEERRMIRDVEEAGGVMYVLIIMIIKEEMEERRMIRDVEEAGGIMYVFKKYFLKYMFCVG